MKKSLLFAAAAVLSLGSQARTLSPDEALERMHSAGGPAKISAKAQPRLVRTATAVDGTPAVYAFDNGADAGGFLILSADDMAYPLLAYSDHGTLGAELPPALEWWMSEYAAQIQYAREHQASNKAFVMPKTTEGRQAVEPLLKTHWDQGEPYNNLCPQAGVERTWTGCVATSMAQVMKYWEYPEKGQNSISYNAETVEKRLSLNFALRKFDWDNMLETYADGNFSQEQADAVAYLMKACGYAVKMDYGTASSGALELAVPFAFVNYFNYDPNVEYCLRLAYTAGEWETKLYNDIAAGCPVMYGGGSMIGGGHSFVCDGYDGNGLFHFNWGWTGMSDGYFSIDALNPYALGAGGGGGGGYNFTQDAIFGIRPPTGDPVVERPLTLVQTGSLAAYFEDGKLLFDLYAENSPMWVNYNNATLDLSFGVQVTKEGDDEFFSEMPITDKTVTVKPGYATAPVQMECGIKIADLGAFDNGTYKLTICVIHQDSGSYVPVLPGSGYANYIYLTKKDGEMTIGVADCWRLQVTEAELVGGAYYGLCSKVRVTVRNNSDIQMSRGFAPCIIDSIGEVMLLGESVMITVNPGESVTREWTTSMYQLDQFWGVYKDTEMTFSLFDESTYNLWYEDVWQTVTVHPFPGMPAVEATTPKVEGATFNRLLNAYVVQDVENLNVSSTLTLKDGVYGYETYAVLVDQNLQDVLDYNGETIFMSEAGETYNFKTFIPASSIADGNRYFLMLGFAYAGNLMQLSPNVIQIIIQSSGIDDIAVDSDDSAPVEYFNLQGVPVKDPGPGIYIRRQGSKSEKVRL